MRLGLCLQIEEITSKKYDFADFIEVNCWQIYELSDEAFEEFANYMKEHKVKTYSANCMVPGYIKLTGPTFDEEKVRIFAHKAYARLKRLNVSVVVFGSGGAKNVEEGFPRDVAKKQLVRALEIFSDVAKEYGLTIVIEPLRRAEVNIVNTLEEGNEYVELCHRENVKLLGDIYHMAENGEPLSEFERFQKNLSHVHLSTKSRLEPSSEEDVVYFEDTVKLLKEIGYTGDVSYEGGKPDDLSPFVPIYERLRKLL